MDRNQIIDKVKEILAEEFEADAGLMADDAPLLKTLDLDSLDVVDLVVLVERNFGFKMQTSDFAVIKTFSDLYDVIGAHVK
ncbi:MAG: acyl carrier protein [Bacteroidales bacterium]|nr:acyl carrier protein [Bacteroidales bacterium]MDE6872343.1 acyl carrier protein [Bacteroidales bacterium]MDE7127879.1 acyl carrier protein [Bacteroidales bacterium]